MSVWVTDAGFGPVGDADGPVIASDTAPDALPDLHTARTLRVDFPSFADGRGFTLAVLLRRRGYRGRLIARGHLLADQYAMARRAGFDGVEIADDLAARQPEPHWLARADWRTGDYRARLGRLSSDAATA